MAGNPYEDRFPVNRTLPEQGRPREELLAELATMAEEEDKAWETGKCSGTMYCGDHEHYAFMNEAFGLFAHVNALQRDMCPSQTKFEGEIIAMTLDLLHAEAVTDTEPVGLVTTGGTGSILHAMIAYREHGATRGVTTPNVIKPETAHPAFDKGCHLFGIEVRNAPVDPKTLHRRRRLGGRRTSTTTRSRSSGRRATTATAPSTRSTRCPTSRCEHGIGLHVDGCLGGWILPFGQELGYDIPNFDFRVPGVTSISADTHKYGYAFKGTSVLAFRDKALRNGQYFFLTGWTRREVLLPRHRGLPLRRAARRHVGRARLARPRGLPRVRQGDLRDRGHDEGRGPLAPGAADHGRAHVRVQLHARTSSTSTTSTTSCGPAAGGSTASSTRTRSTWR